MGLIENINNALEWEPVNIFHDTSVEIDLDNDTYTVYHYTELGEFMRRLPVFIEIIPKFIYYVVSYSLYYIFIKIPWWIFTSTFIPQRWL